MDSMTLIYNLRTGTIKAAFSGAQDMNVLYGDEAEDYKLIWGQLVAPNDNYVLSNITQFKINTATQTIEMLPTVVNKYPIASQ
jgi:hypothetical protein